MSKANLFCPLLTVAVLTGFTLLSNSSALGQSADVSPVFPSTLNAAIDKNEQKLRNTPWRSADRKRPKPIASLPSAQTQIDQVNLKPRMPSKSPMSIPMKKVSSRVQSPSSLTPPAKTNPERNSASSSSSISPSYSLNDRSLSQHESNPVEEPDFGTVMTFPASERTAVAANRNVDRDHMRQYEQMRNVNPRPAKNQQVIPSNVYRAPNKRPFSQASTMINADRSVADDQPNSTDPIIPADTVLQMSVIGPEYLLENAADEFEIVIANTSDEITGEIIVQLHVTEDLTVTDLDRKAWLSEELRTVSWRVEPLEGGGKEAIRFRAVSATPGTHQQSLSMGMNNVFQGRTVFNAVVVENKDSESKLQPDFEN